MIIGPLTTQPDVSMNKRISMCGFCDFVSDGSGATAIGYAIIASGIARAIIFVVMCPSTTLQTKYPSVATASR
jgi:Flp pilus assembly pilin Flp